MVYWYMNSPEWNQILTVDEEVSHRGSVDYNHLSMIIRKSTVSVADSSEELSDALGSKPALI